MYLLFQSMLHATQNRMNQKAKMFQSYSFRSIYLSSFRCESNYLHQCVIHKYHPWIYRTKSYTNIWIYIFFQTFACLYLSTLYSFTCVAESRLIYGLRDNDTTFDCYSSVYHTEWKWSLWTYGMWNLKWALEKSLDI